MTGSGLSRDWDAYDVYLFDIDGTLLNCTDAVHYFALCDALTELAGRPMNLDGVTAHGNTDVGILRDALRLAQVPDERWRSRLVEMRERMGRFVDQRRAELSTSVLPGVVDVLQHLRRRHARLGVATGNLEAIGRLKLKDAGLLDWFDFGGFSDAYEYRKDVFAGALAKARAAAGDGAAVCVVGDTPLDIRAAQENDLEVIAVATGIYSREQLLLERPNLCVSSLSELMDHAQQRIGPPR